ncbi:MAG: hypothetical protein QOG80_3059 [Pseudonocardiales bacterium]|jgi:hypothetical protein|nr:hypothetical protein [Pseudonocardiales bacterium]
MSAGDDYTAVAIEQLDALEAGPDAALYAAILDTCELIFGNPSQARARSTAITARHGIRCRLHVADHYPYTVFWSAEGPRILAVFPHP